MKRLIYILVAIGLALTTAVIASVIIAGPNGLIIVILAATLFLPLSAIFICIEEIIVGGKMAKIIASVVLGVVLLMLTIWISVEQQSALIEYCNGTPVSEWTTPLPRECGGTSIDTFSSRPTTTVDN